MNIYETPLLQPTEITTTESHNLKMLS